MVKHGKGRRLVKLVVQPPPQSVVLPLFKLPLFSAKKKRERKYLHCIAPSSFIEIYEVYSVVPFRVGSACLKVPRDVINYLMLWKKAPFPVTFPSQSPSPPATRRQTKAITLKLFNEALLVGSFAGSFRPVFSSVRQGFREAEDY